MDKRKYNIIITGGNGFIGRRLRRRLSDKDRFLLLTRNKALANGESLFHWEPQLEKMPPDIPKNIYGVIHLAGAGIMDKHWSKAYKHEIVNSRTSSIRTITNWLNLHSIQPEVEIFASGVGFYGNHPTRAFNEGDYPINEDFLSRVCRQWEDASRDSPASRRYTMRIGVVLDKKEGAFPRLRGPALLPVFPILGKGHQMISWIHIDDLCSVFELALAGELPSGTYNAVSPHAVSQRELSQTMALIRGGGLSPTVPETLLRVILGERSICVLNSTWALSQSLSVSGFTFYFPKIDSALEELIG